MNSYGYELILDLHKCIVPGKNTFFGSWKRRRFLGKFFRNLCHEIDMVPCKLVFWDDMWVLPWNRQTKPRTTGTSAVQFIITSNITIHVLEKLDAVYINIFSCKEFDPLIALSFCRRYLVVGENESNYQFIERK